MNQLDILQIKKVNKFPIEHERIEVQNKVDKEEAIAEYKVDFG